MKTWEYKIINVRSENYSMDPRRAEELNRLGDDGWELVLPFLVFFCLYGFSPRTNISTRTA